MFSYPKAIFVLLSFTKFRFIFLSLFAFDTLFNFLLASKIVSTIPLILQLTQTFRIKTNILSLQRCYKNVLQAMIAFTIERAANGWVLKTFWRSYVMLLSGYVAQFQYLLFTVYMHQFYVRDHTILRKWSIQKRL